MAIWRPRPTRPPWQPQYMPGTPPQDAAAPGGPANLKTYNGIAKASVKTINGVAMASIKTFNGVT